jgi:transcriptional regulator with XRE-family HTH domain
MHPMTLRVGAGMEMTGQRKLKRGERTRTGKDKPIGKGAGAYLWTLRDLQGFTREQVEEAVGAMLGKSTPIGHATIIGIENGARMPSYDIISGVLVYLKGDWADLFNLMLHNASKEEGIKMAHNRIAMNAIGSTTTAMRGMIEGLSEEDVKRVIEVFSNETLRAVVDRMIDNPEAVRIINAVLDARRE